MLEIVQILGSLGEFFGAVAVVVTLLLLVRQIRENTKSTAATASATYMQAYSNMNLVLSDPERARILRKGMVAPDDLSPDEQMSYNHMLWGSIPVWESIYKMYIDDIAPQSAWLVARTDMAAISSTPGGKRFFESQLSIYEVAFPEFAEEISACIAEMPVYEAVVPGEGFQQPDSPQGLP